MWNDLKVSLSALDANNAWMQVITNNLANARTVKTPDGGPYKRETVVFEQMLDQDGGGVKVSQVLQETRPPEMRYEPGSPMADGKGMVAYPAIDLAQEMSELSMASRSYEANAVALSNAKEMMKRAMDI
jgi:flagellar basal-body rod protein FlgC